MMYKLKFSEKYIIKNLFMQIQQQKKKNQIGNTRVKVAIRVRPMNPKQADNNQQQCVSCISRNQIRLNKDLKFDRVFNEFAKQQQIYEECVKDLIKKCFEGYNATVIAYGQTGSGKTYTMGTSNIYSTTQSEMGILPRVINQIYKQVESRKKVIFHIKASFLEIYNQEIIDLLATQIPIKGVKNKNSPNIAEKDGVISLIGVNQIQVHEGNELAGILERGAFQRSTAKTLMNDTSSRSHAIFTITIQQELITEENKQKEKQKIDEGSITAKFHFVDLAGSERLKKTGATGSIMKEGININMGLLCLGNVINALSNGEKKGNFVPYRNSKLTRILQDSLGGNSNTYVIACISPAKCNLEETNCTLLYASRAMNIKNKPIVNRDPISTLKQKIFDLEKQNKSLRTLLNESGIEIKQTEKKTNIFSNGQEYEQLRQLQQVNISLQKKIDDLHTDIIKEKKKRSEIEINLDAIRRQNDIMRLKFEQISKQVPNINLYDIKPQTSLLDNYVRMIEQLKVVIEQKQNITNQMQKSYEELVASSQRDEKILLDQTKQIYKLKKQIIDLYTKKQKMQEQQPQQVQFMPQIQLMEIEQQQNLEEDRIIKHEQVQFEQSSENTYMQIDNMNKVITQREKQLKEMTNNQIDLQYRLITQMKEEYHSKIKNLQKQKDRLQKQMHLIQKHKEQKNTNTFERDKVIMAMKAKKESLEIELKQYKKKQKQQQNMERLVQNQKQKIKQLSNEIKNFRVQKNQLNKQLKDDKQRFEKFKLDRLKEILEMKRKDIEKQYQIKKQANQNKKMLQTITKKDQEAKRLKRVNQTLKQILQPKTKEVRSFKRQTVQNAALNANFNSNNNNLYINYHDIFNQIITKLLWELDFEAEMVKIQSEIAQNQSELNKQIEYDGKLKLQIQRLKMAKKHYNSQNTERIQQYQNIRENLSITLQSLQQTLNYNRSRLQSLMMTQSQKFDIETDLIYNKSYDNIETMRKFLRVFFQKISFLLKDGIKHKQIIKSQKIENNMLKSKVDQLEQQLMITNTQYQQNLTKLRQQFLIRSLPVEEQTLNSPTKSNVKIQEKQKVDKKFYEKKINDLLKKNKQLSLELQQSKRKCDVVYQKYQVVKKIGNKDKFIGRAPKDDDQMFKIQTLKQKRIQRSNNSSFASFSHHQTNLALQELTNQLQMNHLQSNSTHSLNNISLTARCSTNERQKTLQQFILQQQHNQENHKLEWQCVAKFDAHTNPVLSLTQQSNILISTSNKSLKLWDLESNKIISDLTGAYLNGSIRAVIISQNKNIMITACDKFLTLWDLVSLQVINTLKGHKDEIRVLNLYEDTLFSGGKGSSTSGSIFSWDLRNFGIVQEAERNQDVFSFATHNRTLYYGSRNHQVRRLNIENMDSLSPFDQPHYDTVSCMTTIDDYLISGSKDKNLKLWSLNSPYKNLRCTSYAHNDWINTIQPARQFPLFFSGARNGEVKVGRIQKQKIEFMGSMNCHDQSVNSLCVLQNDRIATGSNDKTIKIWKATKQTMSELKKMRQQNESF